MSESIIDALRSMGVVEVGPGEPARKSPHDVLVMTLREYLADYQKVCPFKVGDLVTPKASGPIPDAGDPFIVAEVFPEPIRMLGRADKMYNMAFGAKVDIRVLHEANGDIVANMAESWMYEPWVPKVDTDKPAN